MEKEENKLAFMKFAEDELFGSKSTNVRRNTIIARDDDEDEDPVQEDP
jgi:hypothetical protein